MYTPLRSDPNINLHGHLIYLEQHFCANAVLQSATEKATMGMLLELTDINGFLSNVQCPLY